MIGLVMLASAVASLTLPNGTVRYAAPPAWVAPSPAASAEPPIADSALRFRYSDQQIHIGPEGQSKYIAYRLTVLKPEALQAGNITLTWQPANGSATVHWLRLIRNGHPLDVLTGNKFKVIQREGGLDQAMLSGELTALLQVADLRVGDELEFAATIVDRDPTIGDHVFGFAALPTDGMPGVYRIRLDWPTARPLSTRATRDLPQSPPVASGGRTVLSYELRDPGAAIENDGAPLRYNVRRLVEFSDFADWLDLSRMFSTIYADAAKLSSASPVRAEAARITAATSDPLQRAQTALQLVEDQVRYVYVGLDGGNYRPAPADLTWSRRFGDCKGKSVLLIALLRALAIDAEPVLVNLGDDPGTNTRLPSPGLFNHVVVRARIAGTTYWLDPTRLGDRFFDTMPGPTFQWALPLKPNGAALERLPITPTTMPELISVIDIDARAGADMPAKISAQTVLRHDQAFATKQLLSGSTPADAERKLQSYWRGQMSWVDPAKVAWRYDERHSLLLLSITGEGRPDWEGDAANGRAMDIPGAGFNPPPLRRRPRAQDQTAPWTLDFPHFTCFVTTIRLPVAGPTRHWAYFATPMNVRLGNTLYWRESGLSGDVMRTVMSKQTFAAEDSGEDVKSINAAIPLFNNKVSRVYETSAASGPGAPPLASIPFADNTDWAADAARCGPPNR